MLAYQGNIIRHKFIYIFGKLVRSVVTQATTDRGISNPINKTAIRRHTKKLKWNNCQQTLINFQFLIEGIVGCAIQELHNHTAAIKLT